MNPSERTNDEGSAPATRADVQAEVERMRVDLVKHIDDQLEAVRHWIVLGFVALGILVVFFGLFGKVRELTVAELGLALHYDQTLASRSPEVMGLLISLAKQPVITHETALHGPVQYATKSVGPEDAVDALIWACGAGVPALRELYADRASIEHYETRMRIELVAREGFDPARVDLSTGWPNPCR